MQTEDSTFCVLQYTMTEVISHCTSQFTLPLLFIFFKKYEKLKYFYATDVDFSSYKQLTLSTVMIALEMSVYIVLYLSISMIHSQKNFL